MVNNGKANKIAKYAIMFAIIFVAIMLDRVISLGLPTSTAAVVLLVTFSFCFLDNTFSTGVIACALFGLASLFKEFIFPSSVATFPIYVWPIITVLPRVVMGFAAFSVYRIMMKFTGKMANKYYRQTVSIIIATFFGLIANTVLFLSTLNLCKICFGKDYTTLILVIKGVLITNIIPEYLISMILAPHVVLGVRRGLKLGMEPNCSVDSKKHIAATASPDNGVKGCGDSSKNLAAVENCSRDKFVEVCGNVQIDLHGTPDSFSVKTSRQGAINYICIEFRNSRNVAVLISKVQK